MSKKIIKPFSFIFILLLSVFLVSCQKNTLKSSDLEGVWKMKREIIIVSGEDYCKYDKSVILLEYENDNLLFSEIYSLYDDGNEVNQKTLNTNKTNYNDNFKKLLKFQDNKIEKAYDYEENLPNGLSIKKVKINKDLIEVRFLNDRTDENLMISEIYIVLTKTDLKF